MELQKIRTEQFRLFKQNCDEVRNDIIKIEKVLYKILHNLEVDPNSKLDLIAIYSMFWHENVVFIDSKHLKKLDLKFDNLMWFIEFDQLEKQLIRLWESENYFFNINSFLEISILNLHQGLSSSLLNSNEQLKIYHNGLSTNKLAVEMRNFKRREERLNFNNKQFDRFLREYLNRHGVSIDQLINVSNQPKNDNLKQLKLYPLPPTMYKGIPNSNNALPELFDLIKLISPNKELKSEDEYENSEESGYYNYKDYKRRTVMKIFGGGNL